MVVAVTGVAGFIGMHVARALLDRGECVLGIDNLNPYYPVALKRERLAELQSHGPAFAFHEIDIADYTALEALFRSTQVRRVIHLAAQAGVRYSLENPQAYVQSNLVGHANILEIVRRFEIEHLVYASSSSVYGANAKQPFAETDPVDQPVSLYAATKRANELMSHTYAHLYGLSQIGLRFFTVYGPWGRPDMAPWLFTAAILKGEPIQVYNHGRMKRDFTYIDDVVTGILAAADAQPQGAGAARHRVLNIGNNRPENLLDFIGAIERAAGKKAEMVFAPMQPGDVVETYADLRQIGAAFDYRPTTPIAVGVPAFVAWFKRRHNMN